MRATRSPLARGARLVVGRAVIWPSRWSCARVLAHELASLAPGDRVAVLTGPSNARVRRAVDDHAEGLYVTLVETGLPPWVEKARLAGPGPFALMVDATGTPREEVERFRRTFLHLRPRGVYLVPTLGRRVPGSPGHALHQYAVGLRQAPRNQGTRQGRFAAAVGRVTRSAGTVSVVRRGWSVAMLREREMTEVLRVAPERGRTLQVVPGSQVPTGEVARSPYYRGGPELEPSTAPDLHLREYGDVVCARGGLVLQGNLLTPDSFRQHLVPVLTHDRLDPVGAGFAIPDRRVRRPTPVLEGAFFHLANAHQAHFGHTLIEPVSRLWALEEARRRYPDLRVILGTGDPGKVPAWQLTLLEAAGIRREELVLFRGHQRVELLLAATPMYSMPTYAHPALTQTWDRLLERLLEKAPERDYPRRLFVTRTHEKRACRNRLEVEELFARHGFEVVLPQRHPLPEQVAMFENAQVIAGFAGSALLTTMFSSRPKHVVVVSPTSYRSNNELLIGALRGHRVSLAVCRSEIEQPPSGRSTAAFQSGFTCDMSREGRWLTEVLSGF